MIKKILIILFFFSLNGISFGIEKSIVVKFQINDDLITNYDIVKEAKYLIALNKDLGDINKKQLNEFAKNSLIKEKIKKKEIERYYKINYEADSIDVYIESIMKNLGILSRTDFETYLSKYETNIKEVRKKLVIEQSWNKLIIDIYKDRIVIDESKISETLENLIREKKQQVSLELYEIFFSENNKDDHLKKYNEIISSIENLGFEKTAIIHSLSDTAKQGGKIGWINQNQISKQILKELRDLKPGSYTAPINTAGGSLILFVKDIKQSSAENIDKQLEISKIVTSEKNRQLNEFSVIHYKKTENKSYVKAF